MTTTVVIGPPGGGKTTYVKKKNRGGVVVDIDHIHQAITLRRNPTGKYVSLAIEMGHYLERVAHKHTDQLWVITTRWETMHRMTADRLVVIAPPASTCTARKKYPGGVDLAKRWWAEFGHPYCTEQSVFKKLTRPVGSIEIITD